MMTYIASTQGRSLTLAILELESTHGKAREAVEREEEWEEEEEEEEEEEKGQRKEHEGNDHEMSDGDEE